MLRELKLPPINVSMHDTTNAPELSGTYPGKPGDISEHSGTFVVSLIGTVMVAISIPVSIPRVFLKTISGNIVAFPITIVCV